METSISPLQAPDSAGSSVDPGSRDVDASTAAQQIIASAVDAYYGILLDLRKRETQHLISKNRLRRDISAQQDTTPSNPHSGNIGVDSATRKAEKPMKLHELLKSQGTKLPTTKKAEFPTTNRFSRKLAGIREQGQKDSTSSPQNVTGMISKSIFKRMADMSKQEFFIDLKTPSDSQKRLKEVHPVREAKVPFGDFTSKAIECSACGGKITENQPKPIKSQSADENSIVEGSVGVTDSKNDLIAKAALLYHAKKAQEKYDKAKPGSVEYSLFEESAPKVLHPDDKKNQSPKKKIAKAAAAMSAPKAPTAPGMGSPKLSGGAPTKPPTSTATANTTANTIGKAEESPEASKCKQCGRVGKKIVTKAILPFSEQKGAQAAAMGVPQGSQSEQRAVPHDPSDYDPDLYRPTGPVKSGLLTQEEFNQAGATMPGLGVTPRPAQPIRSPAVHRNVRYK